MRCDTLEKNITNFVRQFGIKRAFNAKEFAYYYGGGYLSFTCQRYSDDINLIKHIENTYDVEDLEPWFFIFSILHEVGHHMTLDSLTEEDLINEKLLRQIVTDDNAYFNLPAEDLANRWAINYLINNTEKCWKFQRKCFTILKHLYKKNRYPN